MIGFHSHECHRAGVSGLVAWFRRLAASKWARSSEVERLERLESIDIAVVDLVRNIFRKKKYGTALGDFLPSRMLHQSSLRTQNSVGMRDNVPTSIQGSV